MPNGKTWPVDKPWPVAQAEFQGYMRAKMEGVEDRLENGDNHFEAIEKRCITRGKEIDFNRFVVKIIVAISCIAGTALIGAIVKLVFFR